MERKLAASLLLEDLVGVYHQDVVEVRVDVLPDDIIEIAYCAHVIGCIGYLFSPALAANIGGEKVEYRDRQLRIDFPPEEVPGRLSAALGVRVVAVDDLQYPPALPGDERVPDPERGVRRQSAERRRAALYSLYGGPKPVAAPHRSAGWSQGEQECATCTT